MTGTSTTDWRSDFGLLDRAAADFFAGIEDVDRAGTNSPQPHALRRAFQHLELDGILCQDNAPVIYFRQVPEIQPEQITRLHRRFWNQGAAPILVLIAPDEVHVYSGRVAGALCVAEAPGWRVAWQT